MRAGRAKATQRNFGHLKAKVEQQQQQHQLRQQHLPVHPLCKQSFFLLSVSRRHLISFSDKKILYGKSRAVTLQAGHVARCPMQAEFPAASVLGLKFALVREVGFANSERKALGIFDTRIRCIMQQTLPTRNKTNLTLAAYFVHLQNVTNSEKIIFYKYVHCPRVGYLLRRECNPCITLATLNAPILNPLYYGVSRAAEMFHCVLVHLSKDRAPPCN